LYGALCNGRRVRSGLIRRLAVLDRLGRGTPGRPRDLDQRALLLLECDLAGRLAIQVDAGRAGLERRPVHLALYVSLQQALDPVPAQLRVLCDDLLANAERERPAFHAIKTPRVEIDEQVEAFAHSGPPHQGSASTRLYVEAFRTPRACSTIKALSARKPRSAS
jgi:hypothetical protein